MGYILRSLGVPVKGPTVICGYNQGILIYNTNKDSELKEKHMAIAYHKVRDISVAGIFKPVKVLRHG